mgnify:CR=1 FL=1
MHTDCSKYLLEAQKLSFGLAICIQQNYCYGQYHACRRYELALVAVGRCGGTLGPCAAGAIRQRQNAAHGGFPLMLWEADGEITGRGPIDATARGHNNAVSLQHLQIASQRQKED